MTLPASGAERICSRLSDFGINPVHGTFSLAVNMNVLDCVYSPREMLLSIARALKADGRLVLSCPYDWSAGVTPLESWLGGHSQRSPAAGASDAMLRSLLTPGAHSSSIDGLKLTAELDQLPWQVRLHDRSTVSYLAHLVVATRTAHQSGAT